MGFVDTSGKIVIQPQYKAVGDFHEDLAPFKRQTNWGYVNKTGEAVIEDTLRRAERFSEGRARAARGATYGFIDTGGNFVITAEGFNTVADFHDGLARVDVMMKPAFIDTTGKRVIDAKFEDAGDFHEGLARAAIIPER